MNGSNAFCGRLGPTIEDPRDVDCEPCKARMSLPYLTEAAEEGIGCGCCGAYPDKGRSALYRLDEMAGKHAATLRTFAKGLGHGDGSALLAIADWLDGGAK